MLGFIFEFWIFPKFNILFLFLKTKSVQISLYVIFFQLYYLNFLFGNKNIDLNLNWEFCNIRILKMCWSYWLCMCTIKVNMHLTFRRSFSFERCFCLDSTNKKWMEHCGNLSIDDKNHEAIITISGVEALVQVDSYCWVFFQTNKLCVSKRCVLNVYVLRL
jgi:hypothetical protein